MLFEKNTIKDFVSPQVWSGNTAGTFTDGPWAPWPSRPPLPPTKFTHQNCPPSCPPSLPCPPSFTSLCFSCGGSLLNVVLLVPYAYSFFLGPLNLDPLKYLIANSKPPCCLPGTLACLGRWLKRLRCLWLWWTGWWDRRWRWRRPGRGRTRSPQGTPYLHRQRRCSYCSCNIKIWYKCLHFKQDYRLTCAFWAVWKKSRTKKLKTQGKKSRFWQNLMNRNKNLPY